jgi:predicted ABC-type ATPase
MRKTAGRSPSSEGFLRRALKSANATSRPVAFVLAGHNGSGKSTLWHERLAAELKIPLINADRLIGSILPPPALETNRLPTWAEQLRDEDERWQRLAQESVQAFTGLIMSRRMPFAFETVFSHWRERADGSFESKADIILQLQKAGYFVVLLFVGLANVELSILRVQTRKQQGGHAVPEVKLRERFARTQKAVGQAAPLADMTLMFDNSRDRRHAYSLVRAQQGKTVWFDCRNPKQSSDQQLQQVARLWLPKLAENFR